MESVDHIYQKLLKFIRPYQKAMVAFSGGVDSALTLKLCLDSLGKENVVAVTSASNSQPRRMLEIAKNVAHTLKVKHQIIQTSEIKNPKYQQNGTDRCFYCKKELYHRMQSLKKKYPMFYIFNGTNWDDLSDHRPGIKAGNELEVVSPLAECGVGKETVRLIAKFLNLTVWDQPASPCLSSRIPYGDRVTAEKLLQIEKAEDILASYGMRYFRVRAHNGLARIETSEKEFAYFSDNLFRRSVKEQFKKIGFSIVTVDLDEFSSGSLNHLIEKPFSGSTNGKGRNIK